MSCHHCETNSANPESGLCDSCENKEKERINGWLYLPALGLILSLIFIPFNIYHYLNLIISHFKETAFISYYAITLIVSMFAMYIVTVMATWSFLRKASKTRNVMIIYYFSGLVLSLTLTVVPNVLYNVALQNHDIGILTGSITGTVIWVPYFIFSKRVREVFVR